MTIGVYYTYKINGPSKVIDNLLKSLDLINVNYKINSDGDKNIILQDCDRLNFDLSNSIIGPNICVLPIDSNIVMNYNNYKKIIVPSNWIKNKYSRWIPEDKISVWPVGIDTNKFIDFSKNEKCYDFLIYYKNRDPQNLTEIIDFLNLKNKTYQIVKYGYYNESDFISLISNSKYGLVIDNTESQGIAIQEMMSCNLPLLVWDITEWNHRGQQYIVPATSVPYWSKECGEIFYNIEELNEKFNLFITKNYEPRNFILNNLSLPKMATEIIQLLNQI